jgi:tetratricopeptide (TPR) repeat protein
MIWSQSVIAEQNEFLDPTGTSVDRFVSYATDALLSLLAAGKHMRDPSAHQAAKSAIGAVHRLLTMTGPGLDRVEADIMTAYELDPKPVYLAWLAYMSTFHVGERYGRRDAEFEEQTRALARRALESGQHNALVLGLVAHVHSYVFHEFSFANDLISSAIEANPFRSMTWDTAALLYSYTDRPDKAMEAALNARRLGKHSPYRHLFDGACCVAALVNGRVEEAIRYGESVMAVQPGFKAVLRYLAASYGHQGDSEHARQVLRKLIELEPDLSLEMLRDGMYPVPSKASAKIIETGLKRIGLPEHL